MSVKSRENNTRLLGYNQMLNRPSALRKGGAACERAA